MEKPSYMSDTEFADLEKMKADVVNVKVAAFDYMDALTRLDARGLEASGHKSLPAALEYVVKTRQMDIKKLTKDYLRKYPDGKNGR